MTTREVLEAIARDGTVIVKSGECNNCSWRPLLLKKLAQNPDYVPYGGIRPCMKNKNYRRGCAGYMPAA